MIDVIIPCYNQAAFLPDAIESVLAQTVKPANIIVINDGSTDHTAEVAKKYPVKLVNQVNKGLPSARNTGIMNSTAEYILPLDADDMLKENCLERITKAAEGNWDVIAPSFKTFGINNQDVILTKVPTLDEFKTGNRLGYFSAIKRSVLLEVGGYNPKMIYGWEDYDLWFDIFKRSKSICILQEPLVLYRTKENSMITHADMHKEELWGQIVKNHRELFQ